jgi:hypothetical protein
LQLYSYIRIVLAKTRKSEKVSAGFRDHKYSGGAHGISHVQF